MGDDNGDGVKNWFEYWKKDKDYATSHGNVDKVVYGGYSKGTGGTTAYPWTGTIKLYDDATTVRTDTDWDLPSGMSAPFGELKGIDAVENILTHELLHRYCTQYVVVRLYDDPKTDRKVSSLSGLDIDDYYVRPDAKFLTQAQVDFGWEDSDGDWIPDKLEEALRIQFNWYYIVYGVHIFDPNSKFSAAYGPICSYWNYEQEVLARLVSLEVK